MKLAVQTGPLGVPVLPVVLVPGVVLPVVVPVPLLTPLLTEPPPPPPQASSNDDTRTTPNLRSNMAFSLFERDSFSHAKWPLAHLKQAHAAMLYVAKLFQV
jgi:hypothetical protein